MVFLGTLVLRSGPRSRSLRHVQIAADPTSSPEVPFVMRWIPVADQKDRGLWERDMPLTKLSEQARQGRKTADWLKKIPLRAYGAFLGSKLSATFYMAN